MLKLKKIIFSKVSFQGLPQVVGLALAVFIFFQFRSSLSSIKFEEIRSGILNLSLSQVLQSLFLTLSSFLILGFIEYRNYKKMGIVILNFRTAFFISWTSNSLSNYISFAGLSGAATRLRLLKYQDTDVKKALPAIILNSTYLWSGYSLLSLAAVVFYSLPNTKDIVLPSYSRQGLISFYSFAVFAFSFAFLAPYPARWVKRKIDLQLPTFQFSLQQTLMSSIDWCVSAAVLYILLPQSYALSFGTFLSVFLSAQLLGLISNVPAGLGIVEAFILATNQGINSTELLGPLVFYRLIFYLLPLGLALISLLGYEIKQQSPLFAKSIHHLFGRMTNLLPHLIAAFAFFEGAYLIGSDFTPLDPLTSLIFTSIIPIQVINASYFYSSIFGIFLIALSFGLYQKSRFSWALTILTLSGTLALSILKGMKMTELSVLLGTITLLLYFRSNFYRQARALTQKFSSKWYLLNSLLLIGICGIFLASRELVHENYWWSFENSLNTINSEKIIIFISVALVSVSLLWLGKPSENRNSKIPKNKQLEQAQLLKTITAIVHDSHYTSSQLALLGDKQFLLNDEGNSFIMYSKKGNTWVAMGDAVGPNQLDANLIRKFIKTSDSFGCNALFYQIRHDQLSIYHDLGFKLIKIGEEARVNISNFSLEGRDKKALRNSINRMHAEGVEFKILSPEQSIERWAEIESVSQSWIGKSGLKEKGFSLGYLDKTYQSRHNHAVLEKNNKIVAFANIWDSANKYELSVDLMRYSDEAPPGAIDCLFVMMIQYGRDMGYSWFNLGMAPLAGLEESVATPVWNVIGSFLYENGNRFYNFQGVRKFKEKFSPEWESRYIAVKSGFNVVGSMVDLTLLISQSKQNEQKEAA